MNTEPQHLWFPELGYFVVATPGDRTDEGRLCVVSFDIYKAYDVGDGITFDGCPPSQEYEECEPTASGYVKFDGCSNWKFGGEYTHIHFCERDDPMKLATAMAACHDHAGELFGGFA